MPPLPGIFPDYAAPIVRNQPEGRELAMARWGMPSPIFALKGRSSDPGITIVVRNVASPHWRRWLGVGEPLRGALHQLRRKRADARWTRPPIWSAVMPVILTTRAEINLWRRRPAGNAGTPAPLPDDALTIVARGGKKDEGGLAV